MKTITISVDDETYRLYQSRADAVGTSVEEWVSARLAHLLPRPIPESAEDNWRETWAPVQARIDARAKARGADQQTAIKLTRDELHDRNALR